MSLPYAVALAIPLIVSFYISLVLPGGAPRWAWMWSTLLAIFAACKWLTAAQAIGRLGEVRAWRFAAYWFGWPGMDAAAFLSTSSRAAPAQPLEWAQAVAKCAIGAWLLWWAVSYAAGSVLVAGWCGMVGIAFLLHFGVFHLLSLLWRRLGVAAPRIFVSPLGAHSVSDFWGARWNVAFRDLAHRYVFRPLVRRLGAVGASLATFAASGLVHELVISIPAGGGYGLPTLYFALQWMGVCAERSELGMRWGLGKGVTGRLFAWVVVAGPAYMLFHPPFVRVVLVPFLRSIGSL